MMFYLMDFGDFFCVIPDKEFQSDGQIVTGLYIENRN